MPIFAAPERSRSETRQSSRVRGASGANAKRRRRALSFGLLAFATWCVDCRRVTAEPKAGAAAVRPSKIVIAESIYDGKLNAGWQDWGWGAHDLAQGAARINLSNYGGWMLHHDVLSKEYGG